MKLLSLRILHLLLVTGSEEGGYTHFIDERGGQNVHVICRKVYASSHGHHLGLQPVKSESGSRGF